MFIIILSLFSLVAASDPWMHSVHLYGSENHPSVLKTSSVLYDHVVRKIVLEDERTVSCNIPLDPTFSISEELLKIQAGTIKPYQNIPYLKALEVLYPLKDLCVFYQTFEFLWEFCYKKYIRQYDDAQTVRDQQKNQYEEFFIGYSSHYNTATNQTEGLNVPFWANLNLINQNITSNSSAYLVNDTYQFDMQPNLVTPDIYGFYFKLQGIQRQQSYELSVKLSYNTQDRAIEILFISDPSPCIYIREYGVKGQYTKMDKRYLNQTLLNRGYWVVVDFGQNELILGHGEVLSQASQMVRYKIRGKQQPTNLTIKFLPSKSIRVDSIFALSLAEFQPRTLPMMNTQPQFNTLNYSAFSVLEGQGDVQFQHLEVYSGGSFCPAVNAPRVIEVRMVCSKDSLMEIMEITEPRICVYKMNVGTSLLCDPDEMDVSKPSESIMGQMMICTIDE